MLWLYGRAALCCFYRRKAVTHIMRFTITMSMMPNDMNRLENDGKDKYPKQGNRYVFFQPYQFLILTITSCTRSFN